MPVFLILIFLFINLPTQAKNNSQILMETAQKQEKNLLEKHQVINNKFLEDFCMKLVHEMKLYKLKQCKFIQSPIINAYVLANGHVYFSSAMMEQIRNTHQWAAILAHENAHLELNHYIKLLEKYQNPGFFFPKSKFKKMMREHENQADEWSKQVLLKHEYDIRQIYFFMQRVAQTSGNKKTYSHIKPSKRFNKKASKELIDDSLTQAIMSAFQLR